MQSEMQPFGIKDFAFGDHAAERELQRNGKSSYGFQDRLLECRIVQRDAAHRHDTRDVEEPPDTLGGVVAAKRSSGVLPPQLFRFIVGWLVDQKPALQTIEEREHVARVDRPILRPPAASRDRWHTQECSNTRPI